MTDNINQFKRGKFQDALAENQNVIDFRNGNVKYPKEAAEYYRAPEITIELEYNTKAGGCSVKTQENNLFDYKIHLKNYTLKQIIKKKLK
ncbi:hypothetical protein [Flavobacterium psychrotolerans]|uniref:Uncharacterized protein n=1 Tax=Flavobacterium psychrotolerans TaxID=2169410 RepID=A0A2U1JR52_9FLAO|nr:hypothetical protein [Flavobacterium psychrotolerans]PWA07308.1 hypothetical protein DB895_00885 [Flavobacterium psychrotolerans]